MEDARQLQEAIWAASVKGARYLLPGAPEPERSERASRLQMNLCAFWRCRGYRLRVRLTPERRIAMWLERKAVTVPRVDLTIESAWNQPGVR